MLREREQVVEAEHAEAAGPLEQDVEQVAGGERVVERPVGGLVGEAEAAGERAEPAVRHLVAHQPAGERAGVDPWVRQAAAGPAARRAPRGTPRSKRDVVADDDRVAARTRANAGSTGSMRGAGSTIAW